MADGWWNLDGAIANCVAGYQAVGAVDYAASKVNLFNPGTNNAANGAAYPTWDGTNGFKLLGSSSQYLTTGITPASGYTLIVRYSNGNNVSTTQSLAGYHKTGARFRLDWISTTARTWASGGYKEESTIATSGVMCVAGQTGYFDGASKVTAIDAWTTTADSGIWIGATNGLGRYSTCYIQAVAIFSGTLTGTQVGLLTTAMNALPVATGCPKQMMYYMKQRGK